MSNRLSRGLVLATTILAVTACKKDSDKLTWEETGRPPVVEHNKQRAASLEAPPMFAHIPADTPYVFAAFEPIPGAYWSHVCEKLCPSWNKAFAELATVGGGNATGLKVVRAVLEELAGNMSGDGLRKLGISTTPRFAIYGLGPMPVFRIEIADAAALRATLDRIEKKAGVSIPTKRMGGQEFWRGDGGTFAAGIVGKELVLTFGHARAVDLALPILFGGAKLDKTMADGSALKKLAGQYGYAAYGLGYVDVRRFVDLATGTEQSIHAQIMAIYHGGSSRGRMRAPMPADSGAEAEPPESGAMPADIAAIAPREPGPHIPGGDVVGRRPTPTGPARGFTSPRCRADLRELSNKIPRLVMGYDEISTKRAIFSAVLETDPAIAKRIKGLETKVPGFSTRIPGRPMFALGVAMHLEKARKLIDDMGGQIASMGRNCGVDGWTDLGKGMDGLLELPMAPSLESLRGGFIALHKMRFSSNGPPSDISGFAIIGVADAPAVLADIGGSMPMLGNIKADGKFHKVSMGPFKQFVKTLRLAAKPEALVLTAGDSSHAMAKKVLADKKGKSPLLLVAEDVGKVTQLTSSIVDNLGGRAGAAYGDMMSSYADVFGLAVFSLHADDKGLSMIGRIDLK